MTRSPTARSTRWRTAPNVYGLSQGQGPGPNTATLGGVSVGNGFGLTSSFYSPVAPNLKGAYTTQFGGGIQYEVLQDLTVGVDYLGRRVGDIIEDMSSDDGTNYYIANPTVSAPWTPTAGPYQGITFNPSNAAGTSFTTGTVYSVNWPKPERSYDAVSVHHQQALLQEVACPGELHLVVAARQLPRPLPR